MGAVDYTLTVFISLTIGSLHFLFWKWATGLVQRNFRKLEAKRAAEKAERRKLDGPEVGPRWGRELANVTCLPCRAGPLFSWAYLFDYSIEARFLFRIKNSIA